MTDNPIDILRRAKIKLSPGLTDAEVAAVEGRYGFRFPPDLRELLQAALPTGAGFPDWRYASETALRQWLDVTEGILFDVEESGFWLAEWGERPADVAEAKRIATGLIAAAPTLIPIYSHRMMPDEPHAAGNPVFSVHQTDVICYGATLTDYLLHEFEPPRSLGCPNSDSYRAIRFWDPDRFAEGCH